MFLYLLAFFSLSSLAQQVIFNPALLQVNDAVGEATFTVKLATVPKDTVYIYFGSQDQLYFTPCMLTFNVSSYNVPQTIETVPIPTVLTYSPSFQLSLFSWSPNEPLYHNKTWSYPVQRTAIQSLSCSVIGDPHVTTVDNSHFDIAATGIFYFVLSDNGQFAVQGRQRSCGASSICTDVIMIKYGTWVGIFSANQTTQQFDIDFQQLPSVYGITVSYSSSPMSYVINLPDGSIITTTMRNFNGMVMYQDVTLTLSGMWNQQIRGMCGSFNDGVQGDTSTVEGFNGKIYSVNNPSQLSAYILSYAVAPNQVLSTSNTVTLPSRSIGTALLSNLGVHICKTPSTSDFGAQTLPSGIVPFDPNANKTVTLTYTVQVQVPYETPNVKVEIDTKVSAGNKTVDTSAQLGQPTNVVLSPAALQAAKTSCSACFADSTCNSLVDSTYYYNTCFSDAQKSGTTDFMDGLKIDYQNKCIASLKKIALQQTNGQNKPSTVLQPSNFQLFQCKKNCNNNGACTKSGCVCKSGFSGPYCGISTQLNNQNPSVIIQQAQNAVGLLRQPSSNTVLPSNFPPVQNTLPPATSFLPVSQKFGNGVPLQTTTSVSPWDGSLGSSMPCQNCITPDNKKACHYQMKYNKFTVDIYITSTQNSIPSSSLPSLPFL